MIDTVRFSVQLNEIEYELLRKKSVEKKATDNDRGVIQYQFLNKKINLGSYSRPITISVSEERKCNIEFSVPKFYYGHNIFLFYPTNETLGKICYQVQKHLQTITKTFPVWLTWSVERVDLCYSWKFDSQEKAEIVMDVIKNFDVPSQKKYTYDTSVMFKGVYTTKFYLKYDEFIEHDIKYFKKLGQAEVGYNLAQLAEGVVRYELTLRGKYLRYLFNTKQVLVGSLTERAIIDLMNKKLLRIVKTNKKIKSFRRVRELLDENMKRHQAADYYLFYVLYFGSPDQREYIKSHYSRWTIWYKLRKLSQLGIGLPSNAISTDFTFSIPSKYVINEINEAAGRASGLAMSGVQ